MIPKGLSVASDATVPCDTIGPRSRPLSNQAEFLPIPRSNFSPGCVFVPASTLFRYRKGHCCRECPSTCLNRNPPLLACLVVQPSGLMRMLPLLELRLSWRLYLGSQTLVLASPLFWSGPISLSDIALLLSCYFCSHPNQQVLFSPGLNLDD